MAACSKHLHELLVSKTKPQHCNYNMTINRAKPAVDPTTFQLHPVWGSSTVWHLWKEKETKKNKNIPLKTFIRSLSVCRFLNRTIKLLRQVRLMSVMLALSFLKWPFASWVIAWERAAILSSEGEHREESQTAGTAARERHNTLMYLQKDNCFDNGSRLTWGGRGNNVLFIYVQKAAQSYWVIIDTYSDLKPENYTSSMFCISGMF